MNSEVIVSCAVTGAADTADKHPDLPITPEQIANAAIEAAKAGAAVAHCHVRDPETGKGSRDPELFREVVDRIRDSDTDVIINLTAGMGGDFFPSEDDPSVAGPGSDVVGADERLKHVEMLLPEICSLDCGHPELRRIRSTCRPPISCVSWPSAIKDCGVKPELEVFDTGHLRFANQMVDEGLIEGPPLYQICLGIPWGAPATPDAMKGMRDMLPEGAEWAGFGISRMEMPMVAQAILLGGHVRVGLEDNLYLERGVLASNGQLVEKAINIIELIGRPRRDPGRGARQAWPQAAQLGPRSFGGGHEREQSSWRRPPCRRRHRCHRRRLGLARPGPRPRRGGQRPPSRSRGTAARLDRQRLAGVGPHRPGARRRPGAAQLHGRPRSGGGRGRLRPGERARGH